MRYLCIAKKLLYVATYVRSYIFYVRMYNCIKTHDSESRGQEEAQQNDN